MLVSGALVAGGIVGELQRAKVFIPSPVIFPHKLGDHGLEGSVRALDGLAVWCPHQCRTMFDVELS